MNDTLLVVSHGVLRRTDTALATEERNVDIYHIPARQKLFEELALPEGGAILAGGSALYVLLRRPPAPWTIMRVMLAAAVLAGCGETPPQRTWTDLFDVREPVALSEDATRSLEAGTKQYRFDRHAFRWRLADPRGPRVSVSGLRAGRLEPWVAQGDGGAVLAGVDLLRLESTGSDVYVNGVRVATDLLSPGEILAYSRSSIFFVTGGPPGSHWHLIEYIWRGDR